MIQDPEFVIKTVAHYYGISKDDIIGRRQTKHIFSARLLVIQLLRNVLDMSYVDIGDSLGHRSPKTILESFKRVRKDDNSKVLYLRFKEAIESVPIHLQEK